MNQKTLSQLEEINKRNAQKNTVCYGFSLGNDLAIVTVVDIYPKVKNKSSFFITVEYCDNIINAKGSISGNTIMFSKFKMMQDDYLPTIHKVVLLHAAALTLKHKKTSILFMVDSADMFKALNLPFWKFGFKKRTGSGKQLYSFAANLKNIAGMAPGGAALPG